MKRRKMKLDTLQEIARAATQAALANFAGYSPPANDNLTLGTFWEDDLTAFELYIAADRPEDAIVLTTTKVNSCTGELVSVQIHEQSWARIAQPLVSADAGRRR
jgi:hypothetical protein